MDEDKAGQFPDQKTVRDRKTYVRSTGLLCGHMSTYVKDICRS